MSQVKSGLIFEVQLVTCQIFVWFKRSFRPLAASSSALCFSLKVSAEPTTWLLHECDIGIEKDGALVGGVEHLQLLLYVDVPFYLQTHFNIVIHGTVLGKEEVLILCYWTEPYIQKQNSLCLNEWGWGSDESYEECGVKKDSMSPPIAEQVYNHFAHAGFQITDIKNTAFYSNIMY